MSYVCQTLTGFRVFGSALAFPFQVLNAGTLAGVRGMNVSGTRCRQWLLYVAAYAYLGGSVASAQDVAEIPFFHAPPGSAGLGGGLRFGQNPYLAPDNDDQVQLDLVPLYLYEGRYLFARGTAGGVHFVNNDDFEFNAFVRYRFQHLDPDINAFYDGLEERKQTIDAGLQFGIKKEWGEFTLNWLGVVRGRNHSCVWRGNGPK